jgi:hypothetical protein
LNPRWHPDNETFLVTYYHHAHLNGALTVEHERRQEEQISQQTHIMHDMSLDHKHSPTYSMHCCVLRLPITMWDTRPRTSKTSDQGRP